MLTWGQHILAGIGGDSSASLLARLTLGSFYVLARFRSFYDPAQPEGCRIFNGSRFASLQRKLCSCGFKRGLTFWTWVAAAVEVGGGLALIAGFLTILAASALLVLTLRATMCTAVAKITEQNPVDRLDCVACYLWRVEGLYIALAALVLLLGPGVFSVDYILGLA